MQSPTIFKFFDALVKEEIAKLGSVEHLSFSFTKKFLILKSFQTALYL